MPTSMACSYDAAKQRRVLHSRRHYAAFLRGTLAPERRASDKPIAIACLRLLTFRPLPDFNLPRLSLCISFSTDFDAFGLYFRPLDFFREDDELELRLERDDALRVLLFLLLDDELERDFFVAAIRF
jgi:hypothetical protein